MIILDFFLTLLGINIFLIIGILLSFILFPKTNIIERCAFSLSLSVGFWGVTSNILNLLKIFDKYYLLLISSLLLVLILIIFKIKIKEDNYYETKYDKSIIFIILFSLFGTIWRFLCLKYFQLNSFSIHNPYGYSFKFIGQEVPNLGFYTGMAQDKTKYIGNIINNNVLEYLHINNSTLIMFFTVFLYLSFIFLIFREFKRKNILTYLGVAIMSIGPIELFYMNNSFYGHSLSYFLILPLFLLFISKNKKIFWLVVPLIIVMINTYYTASVVTILSSIGFIIALIIKEIIETKKIKQITINLFTNRKIIYFSIILLITMTHVFLYSDMGKYSIGRFIDNSDSKIALQNITSITTTNPTEVTEVTEVTNIIKDTSYKDPTFLFLSSIRWQMLFFFLCGLTFIFHLLKLIINKKQWPQEDTVLFLSIIPVLFISYGFWHVNLPTRIFDYFAFFGLMSLTLPIKTFKKISIICFCFILITGFFIARDKKVFFELSAGEYYAAKELVNNKLDGKIFSDQVFINQLILNDYYNVTGADDKNPIIRNLFYQTDPNIFINSIKDLKNSGVDYIAITKRMKEKYILMVNTPQIHMVNKELFDNLESIYNNNDVVVYKTK